MIQLQNIAWRHFENVANSITLSYSFLQVVLCGILRLRNEDVVRSKDAYNIATYSNE